MNDDIRAKIFQTVDDTCGGILLKYAQGVEGRITRAVEHYKKNGIKGELAFDLLLEFERVISVLVVCEKLMIKRNIDKRGAYER